MITSLRSLAFKDLWLKLFSLLLATLMWFTIRSAIQQGGLPSSSLGLGGATTRTFTAVPVSVLSSARQLPWSRVQPDTVEVIVEGSPQVVENLQRSDIRVVVDLSDIVTAQDLKKKIEVSKPASVALLKVEPEQVVITFPH
jgi:YbbR domain-containing protein